MPSDSPWSAREIVTVAGAESRDPTIFLVGETLHIVWSCNRVLYHARHTTVGWSQAIKVSIGEEPVLGATPDGRLQCLFVNRFAGNYEIYHTWFDGAGWALPVNVSQTHGISNQPALAIGADGSYHAAWADTTPGYAVIYHATRVSTFWANRPIPSARGTAPTIAMTPDGDIYVAWQGLRAGKDKYDILCSVLHQGVWSPPETVSDSPTANSILPRLAVSSRGNCHLIWQEERGNLYHIFHADRRPNGWSVPTDVSVVEADCRLPQIVANPFGYMHAIWSEGQMLKHRVRPVEFDAAWREVETVATTCDELTHLVAALSATRRTQLVWKTLDADGVPQLFYAQRAPLPKYTLLVPVVVG